MSVDIEPASNTYKALTKFPLDYYRFSVITFEHDSYVSGSHYKNLAKEYLISNNYRLIAEDVCNVNNPFEDWYIDETEIEESFYSDFISSGLEYTDIIQNIKGSF